eukprot:1291665-Pleurochrysis_carterae.AAC.1
MGCHEPPGDLPCASGGQWEGERRVRREHDSGAQRKTRCKKPRVGEARRRVSPGSRARATAYASAATRKARLNRMDRTEAKGQLSEDANRLVVGAASPVAWAVRSLLGSSGCGVCGTCARVMGDGAGDAAKKGSEALAAGTVP